MDYPAITNHYRLSAVKLLLHSGRLEKAFKRALELDSQRTRVFINDCEEEEQACLCPAILY
jgi:hypothetical protein